MTHQPAPSATDALVVVGGGIIGLACALQLLRGGEPVLVLDPASDPPPPSWGNAGHIATECVEPLASWATLRGLPRQLYTLGGAVAFRPADVPAWLPFAIRYLGACSAGSYLRGVAALGFLMADAMPAWKRLALLLGDPDLVRDHGHWVVYESASRCAAAGRGVGPIGSGHARCRSVDAQRLDELRARVLPALAGGYAYEGTGQVRRPGDVLDALRHGVQERGGAIRQARVMRLAPGHGGGRGPHRLLLEDGSTVQARRVLIAAGARSAALMQDAGHHAPLIAERGYHVEAEAGDWPDFPTVVFEDRSVVVTRFGERLRATSFVEFSRAESAPDARKWQRLKAHVAALGVPLRGPIATWSGPRPTLPDYLPAIGTSRRLPGLAYAFGHQHLGLTLAARTGELVAELLRGPTAVGPLAEFDIERFAR